MSPSPFIATASVPGLTLNNFMRKCIRKGVSEETTIREEEEALAFMEPGGLSSIFQVFMVIGLWVVRICHFVVTSHCPSLASLRIF